jgi:hypothetical protein
MKCTLGKGDLLRLEGGTRGVKLRCLSGTLWLTNGNGADYLVHEGQSFDLAPATTAVAEALGLAEFQLESSAREGAGIRPVQVLDASPRFQLRTWAA